MRGWAMRRGHCHRLKAENGRESKRGRAVFARSLNKVNRFACDDFRPRNASKRELCSLIAEAIDEREDLFAPLEWSMSWVDSIERIDCTEVQLQIQSGKEFDELSTQVPEDEGSDRSSCGTEADWELVPCAEEQPVASQLSLQRTISTPCTAAELAIAVQRKAVSIVPLRMWRQAEERPAPPASRASGRCPAGGATPLVGGHRPRGAGGRGSFAAMWRSSSGRCRQVRRAQTEEKVSRGGRLQPIGETSCRVPSHSRRGGARSFGTCLGPQGPAPAAAARPGGGTALRRDGTAGPRGGVASDFARHRHQKPWLYLPARTAAPQRQQQRRLSQAWVVPWCRHLFSQPSKCSTRSRVLRCSTNLGVWCCGRCDAGDPEAMRQFLHRQRVGDGPVCGRRHSGF